MLKPKRGGTAQAEPRLKGGNPWREEGQEGTDRRHRVTPDRRERTRRQLKTLESRLEVRKNLEREGQEGTAAPKGAVGCGWGETPEGGSSRVLPA